MTTASTLEYDAPTASTMRDIADRLADADRLNVALDLKQQAVTAVRSRHADALVAQAVNDTAQATTTDTAESKRLEAQGRKLAATVADALADLEIAQRIEAAVCGQLIEVESAIRDDAEPVRRMVIEWAHRVACHASAEIRAAFAPPAPPAAVRSLRDALRRAHVLQRGSQSRGLLDALDAVRIPDPVAYSAPVAAGLRYYLPDGEAVEFMAEGWADDAELAPLHDTAAAPRMAFLRLTSYVPRAQRERLAAARPVPVASPVAPVPSVRLPAPRRSAAVRSVPQEINIAGAALADPEFAQFR